MFLPLLLVQYSDGQPMITVTGVIIPDKEEAEFLSTTGIDKWAFYANNWRNTEFLQKAPALTLRERLHMDQSITAKSRALPSKLNYLSRLQGEASAEIVKLYRRYQRFFPQFVHVEM
jgi:hypothetical protein